MDDFRRYDAVAETYERVRAPITAAVAADLVALAEAGTASRVLDVGAGTGTAMVAAETLAPGVRVFGVDYSVPMLAAGRRARPGLRVAGAEAIQLPFGDATFDVVLANFVLPEFTRFDTALFDLIRVLRPGGRLAASAWVNEEDELGRTWRLLVEDVIGPELMASARQQAIPWAERFGDADLLSETLRDAGLHPIRVERRAYRFTMAADDYVSEQATRAAGRFLNEMLGEAGYDAFLTHVREEYRSRFGDEIRDGREALIAIGTKPQR